MAAISEQAEETARAGLGHRGPRGRAPGALAAGAALGVIAAAMAGVLGAAPATATEKAASPPAGVPAEVRVGITPNYPPLAFKEYGAIAGIEPDLAGQLAQMLGVRFTLVEVPWDELVEALAERKVDVVMSGVSITERRKKLVGFTQPYLEIGQMALIRKADMTRLSDPGAMNRKGVRVGVERLTTGARWARDQLDQATIVEVDSIDAGVRALRDGKIDYFVHDAPTVWRVSGRFDDADDQLIGLYRPLTQEQLAWAVRKEDAATLGAALNLALAQLVAEGKLQPILDRWITVKKVSREIAPAR